MARGILSQGTAIVVALVVVKILPVTICVEVNVVYFVKLDLCSDCLGVKTAGSEEVFDLASSGKE